MPSGQRGNFLNHITSIENMASTKNIIQSVPSGNRQMAEADFLSTGANINRIIKDPRGDIWMGTLPNGNEIKLRPSNDGGRSRPTIEICKPNGRPITEVRYGRS